MNEHLRPNLEFFHQQASRIAQRIETLFFTPKDKDERQFLHDRKELVVDFIAERRGQLSYLELRARIIKNHPNNLDLVPYGFQLPAFRITKDFPVEKDDPVFMTKFGLLPLEVIDQNDKLFTLRTGYYFNKKGQAIRHERILKMRDRHELNEKEKEDFDAYEKILKTKRVDFSISESDSRFASLDQRDLGYVAGLLMEFEAGVFEQGRIEGILEEERLE